MCVCVCVCACECVRVCVFCRSKVAEFPRYNWWLRQVTLGVHHKELANGKVSHFLYNSCPHLNI